MIAMYILRCADGSYYVGSARDLDARMLQHAAGVGSRYTSRRMPVALVYVHECTNIGDAYAAEKRVQGWSRAKREALIRGETRLLPALSRKRFPKRGADGGGLDTPAARPAENPPPPVG
ncbi:GIY-YIG nuclease family protein [Protaetiibacter intestinalis]|uniref:GIY-YIG nuclease family protein n=1 Tax=Protaetiibacter intestinalis TaxID=2419774 RepID=A0A387B660_9MICO|nr:GIY-YIG nuclease family protein [Protaetiibacter intestinalis]AYF97827.1 GIY-YIG nuclease family protein [Protaetiibacter intestinalis]